MTVLREKHYHKFSQWIAVTCRAERNCFAFLLSHVVAFWLGQLGTSLLFITLIYVVEPSPSPLLIAPFFSRDFIALDCRIVGFFLKISKEIGKAWLKSLTRAKFASLTRPYGMWGERKKKKASLPSLALCFRPRSRPFVWLLASTWIRKNTDCFADCHCSETKKRLLCRLLSQAHKQRTSKRKREGSRNLWGQIVFAKGYKVQSTSRFLNGK